MGDDVRRFEVQYRNRFLIRTEIGVNIRKYPAILRYLRKWQDKAEVRDARGREWWELRPCNYYDYFEKPKIIYPDIAKESRFVIDQTGFHTDYTVFNIPSDDYFLLAVLNSTPVWEYLKLICSVLGDENKGGRLRFYRQYLEVLPTPVPPTSERNAIAKLAQQTQNLHTQRRKRVEQFLRDLGISPAESSSRNPLEQPWALKQEEFAKRAKHAPSRLFQDARDETAALTGDITRIEHEIDERVAELYGVPLDPNAPPRIAGRESEPRPFD
jgi:hypothetical protein